MSFLLAFLLSFLESEPIIYEKVDSIVITEQVKIPEKIIQEEPVQDICTGPFCSCVIFLRETKGLDVRGDAEFLVPNYFGTPREGDIALFKYSSGVAHAAYVFTSFTDNAFYVHEANFKRGEYTERAIFTDDPFLIGFIRF